MRGPKRWPRQSCCGCRKQPAGGARNSLTRFGISGVVSLLTNRANRGAKCQRKALNANGFGAMSGALHRHEWGGHGWLGPDGACLGR